MSDRVTALENLRGILRSAPDLQDSNHSQLATTVQVLIKSLAVCIEVELSLEKRLTNVETILTKAIDSALAAQLSSNGN